MDNCCSTQGASSVAAPEGLPAPYTEGVGPLTLEGIHSYTAKQDHSHLRLGLQKEGMLLFLEQIGFVQWTGPLPKNFTGDDLLLHWSYNNNYIRDCDLAALLDPEVGAVTAGTAQGVYSNGGLMNVTGYDLAAYIRQWHRAKGFDNLSVCEIILLEPEFQHLRQYIGIANVFWSHIQKESFLGDVSTYHCTNTNNETATVLALDRVHNSIGDRLPCKDSCFFWLDYFSRRQCQSDLNVDCIIKLIKDIGTVVAAVDTKFEYFKESFRVLELCGAVYGGCNLMMITSLSKYRMQQILARDRAEAGEHAEDYWADPVNLAAAQTRCAEDKFMIDALIQQLPGGFDTMTRLVTDNLLKHAA